MFLPEGKKIIPLKRIATNYDFETLGKLCRALTEVSVAFVMRRTMRTQWRKAEEMIVPAGFAQVEYLHDGRARDGGHHVAADGERGVAAKKRHARRRASVGAIAHHADQFTTAHGSDELYGISG